MGRNCDFDPDRAIDNAVETFWSGSYAGTSTEDLCGSMGVSRSSLYNTFGNKAAVYRESLRRYGEQHEQQRRRYLDRPGTGRERLAALLHDVLAQQQDGPGRRSCMVLHAAVEVGGSDEEVAELVRGDLEAFRAVLADLVRAGQDDGSIAAGRPAEATAAVVHAALNGLQVATRVDPGTTQQHDAVDTLLRML